MKPAPFAYVAPRSLAEALALMKRHGDEGKALAGGQSLLPVLNFRLVHMQAHALIFLTGVVLAFFMLPRTAIGLPVLAVMAVVLILLNVLLFAVHREGVVERLFDLAARLPLIGRFARKLEPKRAGIIEVDRQLIATS